MCRRGLRNIGSLREGSFGQMRRKSPAPVRPALQRKRKKQGSGHSASLKVLLVLTDPGRHKEWSQPLESAGWKVERYPLRKIQAECIRLSAPQNKSRQSAEDPHLHSLYRMEKWKLVLRDILDAVLHMAPALESAAILTAEPENLGFRRSALRGKPGECIPAFVCGNEAPLLQLVLEKGKAIYLPEGACAPGAVRTQRTRHAQLFVPLQVHEVSAVMCFQHGGDHPLMDGEYAAARMAVRRLGAYLESAELHSRLNASELRYRSILSAAPFLIALLDSKCTVREINPQLVKELTRQGISPRKAIGTNVLESRVLPEDLRQLLTASLRSGEGFTREEINLSLPRGGEVLRLHIVPLRSEFSAGELLVIAEIITHYHQLMDEAERNERLAAIGRVAASLAHEVNNPLQALRSHLELIRSYPLSDEEREQSFGILEREVERLDETTRRVLGFARPTPDILQPVSIVGVLDQTLALSRNYLQHQQVTIQTDFAEGLAPVQAAAGQLIQVFLNIILNAAHAMNGCGTLGVRANAVGETVEITFSNDGPPIPSDHLPHIFEPFYTTHPEGTGLGLSISHAILQRHKGTIRAENQPRRQGVTFTITLPFAEEGTQIE
jgi:signal transduction histidine kinase